MPMTPDELGTQLDDKMRSAGAQFGQLIERVDAGAVAIGGEHKRHGVAAHQSSVGDGDRNRSFNHTTGLLHAAGFPAARTLAGSPQLRRRDLNRRSVVPGHDQPGTVLNFDALRYVHNTGGYRPVRPKDTTA
jgi:hypothetical protein